MNKETKVSVVAIFEGNQIRRHWDAEKELWYFSVVDVVRVLTDSIDAGAYWRKLKQRLKDEGSEVVTNCHELKFLAKDGKYYLTDAADTEVLLRLIQSIPSPSAEPFKLWLAQVGYERLEETADPELAIDRALRTYLKKGYSREWIYQRSKSKSADSFLFVIPSGVRRSRGIWSDGREIPPLRYASVGMTD